MPPSLALILWLVFLIGLFYWDPAKDRSTSAALWVPVIWLFFLGSRLPSQWLGSGEVVRTAEAFEQGNPLDRTVDTALMLLAIGILATRSFKWQRFFVQNSALTAFLVFTMVSVVWSDFPLVTLKRWFRDFGNYLVILVVLSDRRPLEAIRTVLRRVSYLWIPLSVLLVKYYPELARQYDPWTGIPQITGATTSKNMLGVACMVSGVFFFWDTVVALSKRKEQRIRGVILVNAALAAMTLWLLNICDSATSRLCLMLGCLLIAAAHSKPIRRRPALLMWSIPACFIVYAVLAYGFDINSQIAGAVGRDPTLTDRTKIWAFVIQMQTNPLLGTGYESFWLGPRLLWFWERAGLGHINEAHNGYLETYLNLGILGVLFLAGFLIATYRTVCKRLKPFSPLASLGLAFWAIVLFYSVTEAGFRSGPLWLTFLLVAIAVPVRRVVVPPTSEEPSQFRFFEQDVRTASQR
jgi:O-antigen ligase